MLLALDAGNTNITIGIFRDGELADHRRLRTVREQTSDEWGILLMSLLRYA
ncbi:MAG: type III pantothenate kinase, partial [Acidobacteriota bacterium]|nr:type III pantothenate kinase [Acidobacteriota bacterium]